MLFAFVEPPHHRCDKKYPISRDVIGFNFLEIDKYKFQEVFYDVYVAYPWRGSVIQSIL